MSRYLFAYRGGAGMAETPEDQEKVMAAWGAWFGQLGDAVVDGGAPFGAGTSVTSSDGSGPAGALGGYSIVSAPTLEGAVALTEGCPILGEGGTVEVYECIEMG
jgi:hypothetical protein